MITVTSAPPFATIQDLGRPGFLDSGVPLSGVADRESALALNAVLGNESSAAMIEWAVAGGALSFGCAATVALGGADAVFAVNGESRDSWTAIDVGPDDELRVERIVRGRFLLLAVRGGIDVPVVLGSRSTLLSASIGGFDGRRLRNGDRLPMGVFATSTIVRGRAAAPRTVCDDAIRVMRGPQAHLFDDRAWSTFLESEFAVSRASDRSGYRLDGPSMMHGGSAAMPSEPTCVGAIQVPNGGTPIVLMNDGPTVGGYPKIATIRAADQSQFAQRAPGDRVRFVLDD